GRRARHGDVRLGFKTSPPHASRVSPSPRNGEGGRGVRFLAQGAAVHTFQNEDTVSTDNGASRSALVLGIDTGGTYTDGVLLEYYSRRVLAAHKSLTTRHDYSLGIERVIENIHIDDPASIKMVSISTTLATNAIAEGKGKRVALALI